MSWARVDDGMLDHAKWQRLEALGAREWSDCLAVWLAVCLYANSALTDGAITWARLDRLTPLGKRARSAAERMIDVGLMDRREDGCALHDFLDYNLSASERAEKTAAKTRRQGKWRSSRGASVGATVDASTPASRDASVDIAVDSAPPRARSPSPSPSPSPSESRTRAHVAPDEPTRQARPGLDVDGEQIRRWVQKALEERQIPPKREVKFPMDPGWVKLACWVAVKASYTKRPQRDVAVTLIASWLDDERCVKAGRPISFLFANPDQFWPQEAA